MRNVYRIVAFVIAAGVMLQAAAVAYGFFGLGKYVEGGGTVDKASMQTAHFAGEGGLAFHGIVGTMVLPVLALILLIVGIVAQVAGKVPGALKWSLIVFVATVLQVVLGLFAHTVPVLGVLHGLLALALFALAAMAGVRIGRAAPAAGRTAAPSDSALV